MQQLTRLRELERQVAERVMGDCWHEFVRDEPPAGDPIDLPFWDDGWARRCTRCDKKWDGHYGSLPPTADCDVPRYITNWNAASVLLAHLKKQGWEWTLASDGERACAVLETWGPEYRICDAAVDDGEVTEALALAALRTVEEAEHDGEHQE